MNSESNPRITGLDVLAIPELTIAVAEAANMQGRQKTVMSLSLVCKATRDPALDVLWRKLYSLLPFVKALLGAESVIPADSDGKDVEVSQNSCARCRV